MKKIYYSEAFFDKNEIKAINKVLKNNLNLVDGPQTKYFEKKVASYFGKKYGLLVNSCSSANLLAIKSFNFKKGSNIITPCLSFSTSIAPIIQCGLIPNIVDSEIDTLNIKIEDIEKSITKKTVAFLIPNLVGNICDWKKIYKIAKKYEIKIIEDCADTIGYTTHNKIINYSDVSTTSFYASHIITCAGTGGMICTNNKKQYNKFKILRGWGRSSSIYRESEKINNRFNSKLDNQNYDKKFYFEELGYNFHLSEICAAFGLEQIKKLPSNIKKRISNFEFLYQFINKNLKEEIILPKQLSFIKTPWLAFPIILKKNKMDFRNNLQIYLETNNIQTRPIFSGNILKQPMMKNKHCIRNPKGYQNADYIMNNGILIGCHSKLSKKELNYICSKLKEFFNKN
jgi:CDP-6-deoxy-D-xylo-4-hexulose-3-dehydrase